MNDCIYTGMMDSMVDKLSVIAQSAGEIIMTYYHGTPRAECKPDGSPVTGADRDAEKYIINALRDEWPDIPSIGEESVGAEGRELAGLKRFWLIDPLDGTKEFIKKSGEFTVNIALVEDGFPVCGVVYAPAMELLYTGHCIEGSYRIKDGVKEKLPLHLRQNGLCVTISRSHPTYGVESTFLKALEKKFEVKLQKAGSSLKFCMVAEGSSSLYFRAGKTMYWDSAAGHAVARGAGATVVEWKTHRELTYKNSDLTNPSFMVTWFEWLPLLPTELSS